MIDALQEKTVLYSSKHLYHSVSSVTDKNHFYKTRKAEISPPFSPTIEILPNLQEPVLKAIMFPKTESTVVRTHSQ